MTIRALPFFGDIYSSITQNIFNIKENENNNYAVKSNKKK